jgi:hypothetical protein
MWDNWGKAFRFSFQAEYVFGISIILMAMKEKYDEPETTRRIGAKTRRAAGARETTGTCSKSTSRRKKTARAAAGAETKTPSRRTVTTGTATGRRAKATTTGTTATGITTRTKTEVATRSAK